MVDSKYVCPVAMTVHSRRGSFVPLVTIRRPFLLRASPYTAPLPAFTDAGSGAFSVLTSRAAMLGAGFR